MKTGFFFISFLLPLSGLQAQPPFGKWDKETCERANTAKDAFYLSAEEKNVIFYTNLARLNGSLFAETYLQAYLDSFDMAPHKYVKSLQRDLKKSKSLPPLQPNRELWETATKHAVRLSRGGGMYHSDSPLAENIQMGYKEGLLIVIDLLIDQDVPDYGHRKNLLDEHLRFIGVSIQTQKEYGYCTVMNFAE